MIVQSYPFFVNISYQRFLKKTKTTFKTRQRYSQVQFYCQYYSNNGERTLGRVRNRGRNYGCLCYDRKFLKMIMGWTGLSKRQVYRYLEEFVNKGIILKTDNEIRGLEYKYSSGWIPDWDEDFFKVPLAGMGGKGIDIFTHLEKCHQIQSYPTAEPVKFNISRQTRYYRAVRQAQAVADFEKRKKVSHVWISGVQESIKNKSENTLRSLFKSDYGGFLHLKSGNSPPVKAPWWKCLKLSEYQKVACGFTTQDFAVFYKGGVYLRKYGHQYWKVPKVIKKKRYGYGTGKAQMNIIRKTRPKDLGRSFGPEKPKVGDLNSKPIHNKPKISKEQRIDFNRKVEKNRKLRIEMEMKRYVYKEL